MKFLAALLALPALAAAIPTIYLAGDSKTAKGGGGGVAPNNTEGWGQYLFYSIPPSAATIVNSATAGRSARSYTREGRFQAIIDKVIPGDWVVIEFGTNDGGSPYPAASDNGRADCAGLGNETCPTVYLNQTEIVQTYVTYITNATSLFLAKGAKVVIASPTPNNPWEFGPYNYVPTSFTYGAMYVSSILIPTSIPLPFPLSCSPGYAVNPDYPRLSAQLSGGPAAGVYYVPHSAYAAQAMFNIGGTNITQYFPLDHGHTAPYLASVVAQAFVLGLKCGTSGMQNLVANATSRIEGPLLGTCLSANETVPI